TKVSVRDIYSNGYVTMQVNENILLKDACQFNIGATTSYPSPQGLYEIRFKGNFSAIDYSLLIYEEDNPVYLVANGKELQNFTCVLNFNRKLRVAPGATLNLISPLNMWAKTASIASLAHIFR